MVDWLTVLKGEKFKLEVSYIDLYNNNSTHLLNSSLFMVMIIYLWLFVWLFQ